MKSKLYNDREYFGNIQDYIFYCLKEHKDTELCVWRRDDVTSGCTYGQMYDYVKQIGTFLNKNGKPGAHLALLGKTTEKWIASYLGALCYGDRKSVV